MRPLGTEYSPKAIGAVLQVQVARAVGPTSALQGVAEAPAGVNDELAAAREAHRSSQRLLVMRSDSARLGLPLDTHQEVI